MKSSSSIKWINSVIGNKKFFILFLIIIQIILGISSVIYALIFRNIIDYASNLDSVSFRKYLVLICILVIFQLMLRAIIRYLEEYSKSTFENILKKRLFSKLLQKEYSCITATHSAEWQNRLTSDTVVVSNGLVEILPNIFGMIIKMFGALIMILLLEPRFAYICIPCGFILILVTYSFRKVLKKLHKNIQEKDGQVRIFLQEHLESLMIIRSFSTEQQSIDEITQKMIAHKNARMKRNFFSNICNIGFGGIMNGMYLLGVGYCGYGIIKGTITYGTLMAILQLINQIQSPFANISGYFPKFYSMIASAERLMEVENFKDDIKEILSTNDINHFYNERLSTIELKNISFKYSMDNQEMLLNNINLSINKGDYIAFTGQSGCGKSTIFKILMCFYNPNSGDRFILENNGTKILLDSKWHKLFAYVPQGNQLMSGTIREIISFADKSKMYDDKRIYNALKVSCAYDFVINLENGIDTLLGEKGQGLSEGQMQRIAIARAIFSDNPVLMLDEATSSLDEQTEKNLLENIRSMTNKTVLIVTHRPAVLNICNKVIIFSENGLKERNILNEREF